MKTATRKYQDKLKEIATRTGIDFTRYRDPVLIEKLGNILTIHLYAFKAISVPVLILMLIYWGIAAYALIASKYIAGVIIGLVGIVPSVIVGLLIGMVVLMNTIKSDVQQIFILTIQTVKVILADTNAGIQNRVNSASGSLRNVPRLSDLLQGVIFGIVLPSLQQIIVSKLRILKTPVEYLFSTTIVAVVNSTITVLDEKTSKVLKSPSEKITALTSKVSTISDETAKSVNDNFELIARRLEDAKRIIGSKIDSTGSKIIAPVIFFMVIGLLINIVMLTICFKLIS